MEYGGRQPNAPAGIGPRLYIFDIAGRARRATTSPHASADATGAPHGRFRSWESLPLVYKSSFSSLHGCAPGNKANGGLGILLARRSTTLQQRALTLGIREQCKSCLKYLQAAEIGVLADVAHSGNQAEAQTAGALAAEGQHRASADEHLFLDLMDLLRLVLDSVYAGMFGVLAADGKMVGTRQTGRFPLVSKFLVLVAHECTEPPNVNILSTAKHINCKFSAIAMA
jgi:hypothetical protein